MKSPLVPAILAILVIGAVIAYLFLLSPPNSSSPTNAGTAISSTFITIMPPQTQTQNTKPTTSGQVTSMTGEVTANIASCNAGDKACTITLVNTRGIAVVATGCTLNGQHGIFAPSSSTVPPGGSVNVSCAPPAGGAVPIPGFHVEGSIQLSDGSSVQYIGTWR